MSLRTSPSHRFLAAHDVCAWSLLRCLLCDIIHVHSGLGLCCIPWCTWSMEVPWQAGKLHCWYTLPVSHDHSLQSHALLLPLGRCESLVRKPHLLLLFSLEKDLFLSPLAPLPSTHVFDEPHRMTQKKSLCHQAICFPWCRSPLTETTWWL